MKDGVSKSVKELKINDGALSKQGNRNVAALRNY